MTKRVLAFLMVIAMVFSLVPTVVVAVEEDEVTAGYTMYLQKSHNQTSDLTVDVYLRANMAGQGDVTTFQFDITLAESLDIESVVNPAGVSLAGTGAPKDIDARVVYEPAENSAIAVTDTSKTLVATIELTGDTTEITDWTAAFALSNVEVSTETASYSNGDAAVIASGDEGYGGTVTVEEVPFTACEAHDTSDWTAFVLPEVVSNEHVLTTGNYYLTGDVQLESPLVLDKDATVTICLNGFNITAADGQKLFLLNRLNPTLNICDCTAAEVDGEYTAGKLLPKANWGGAIRVAHNKNAAVKFYSGIIDCSNNNTLSNLSATAVYVEGGTTTLEMLGGKVINAKGQSTTKGGAIVLRSSSIGGETTATISDVVFENCGGTLIDVPSSQDPATLEDGTTLTVRDVTVRDSEAGTQVVNLGGGNFKSVTFEGDCRFDAPVYLPAGETLTLNLGEHADMSIETDVELTEDRFNKRVRMAKGGTLTDDTLLYQNLGVFVAYDAEIGEFFYQEGHTIADKHAVDKNGNKIVFKAWRETTYLPTEGNWYLLNDVEVSEAISDITTNDLNLDLNGKTVTTTGTNTEGRFFSLWNNTLSLFDSTSNYDEDGNWLSSGTGKLTGYTGNYGAIEVNSGATFNLYSGIISDCGSDANDQYGAAVYIYDYQSNRTKRDGGVFNMYGGEITGNTAGLTGAAIATFADAGAADTHVGAKINIYGGKISNNTTVGQTATEGGNGTIRARGTTQINISGGEFSGNTARSGGVLQVDEQAVANITGGTFTENIADNYGGAIYITGAEAQLNITGGEFAENTMDAADYVANTTFCRGGMLYAAAGADVTVKDITVTDHSAYQGGALFITNSTATVENVTFEGNTSTGQGAVAYLEGACDITFTDCMMTGNSAGTAGSAIYMGNGCTAQLKLDSTIITGNQSTAATSTYNACGAVFQYSADPKIILSGATVIAGNTGSGWPQAQDLVFRGSNQTPTVYVDEMSAGGHVNIYSLYGGGRAASDLVQIAEGASAPTTWCCGWITYYETNAVNANTYRDVLGKNVSYIDEDGDGDKEFIFGHYHTDAEGNDYELLPWGTTETVDGKEIFTPTTDTLPTSTDGTNKYYYLTADVSPTNTMEAKAGATVELCTNGFDIIGTATNRAFRNYNGTLTVTDCTAAYDAEGHLLISSQVKNFIRTGSKGAVFVAVDKTTTDAENSVSTFKGLEFGNCYDDSVREASASGGAFFVQFSNSLIVDGCKFNGCHAANGYGGAIEIYSDNTDDAWGTKSITNTVFENNYAGKAGGAIYVLGDMRTVGDATNQIVDTITIDNCVFKGNYANAFPNTDDATLATANTGNGGAIYANRVIVDIDDCVFESNSTKDNGLTLTDINACYGGAIYADTGATLDINETTFTGNTAAKSGGAILHRNSVRVSGSTFKNNAATENGGAFYPWLGANSTLTIQNSGDISCLFEGNSAKNGGAIRTVTKPGSTAYTLDLNISDATFQNNTATAEGGAMYLDGSTTATLSGVTFDSNDATSAGGAIVTRANTVEVDADDCRFLKNTAKSGGALCSYWAGTIAMDDCEFAKNNATTAGGAIWARGNDAFNLNIGTGEAVTEVCTFTGNTSKDGGAIYVTNSGSTNPHVTVKNAHFTKNQATANGAAVAINAICDVTLDGCTIQDNTTGATGAVFAQKDTSVLTLKGKMIITDNIGTTYPKADLFFEAYETDGERHDSTVTLTGLNTESQIGINLSDERYNNAWVLGTATQDVSDCFFTSDLNRFRTYVNGSNQLIATNYVDKNGTSYQVMNDAVAAVQTAGETKFTAQAGNGIDRQDVVLTGDMTIDLNGRIISKIVTGEYTLSLTDSETNDFDVYDGNYGQVTVEGNLAPNCKDGSNHYVVLTGEDGISTAHRVYVSIVSRLLRPISSGAGFKAIYATDRMVTDAAPAFGIEVTFQGKDTADREFRPVPFSGRLEAGLPEDENDNPNEKLLAVTSMVPDDWENPLYGRAYVTVGKATVYSTERNLVMKDMAKKALLDGSGISQIVREQLEAMIEAHNLSID